MIHFLTQKIRGLSLALAMLIFAITACNLSSATADPTSTPLPLQAPIDQLSSQTPSASRPPASQPTAVTPTLMLTPLPAASLDHLAIDLVPFVTGVRQPLDVRYAGDGSGRLFIVSKTGTIHIVQDGTLLPTPFLDISDRVDSSEFERGLLGLAFHPDYVSNGYFFINYTGSSGDTYVTRFSVSNDPNSADADSGHVILVVDQPAANHNGGNLVFGPDGYLYVGLGDGGRADDVFGNGQNGSTLLGSMLRIDINTESAYAIPPDNPFVNDPSVLDEIWARGLRNPWRYSFDRLTGDLYIADVGQNTYEEVNVQPAASTGGENYGWNIMEGLHCFQPPSGCNMTGLVQPVAEYQQPTGCAVTGGYVYRGQQYPPMTGIYFFGDYCTGRVWGLAPAENWHVRELLQRSIQISSFGEDEAGELYVTDISGGTVYQVVALP